MEKKEGGARLAGLAIEVAGELGFGLRDAATGGASDANTTSGAGVPSLDGLGPIGGDDHGPKEWLDLSSVVPRISLLAGLLSRLEGISRPGSSRSPDGEEGSPVDMTAVAFDKPDDLNVIVGQSHFIKTVEDLHEACVNVPALRFGIGFNEAGGPRLGRPRAHGGAAVLARLRREAEPARGGGRRDGAGPRRARRDRRLPAGGCGDRGRRGRSQGASSPIPVKAGSEGSLLTYRHLVEGIPAVLYVDANDDRSSNLYTSPQIE